ncbi:hypothetical protein [Flavobacterium sp.]
MKKFIVTLFLLPMIVTAQSNLDVAIKGGELLLSGLSILKVSKSGTKSQSNVIESICVKNKLVDKIIFRIVGNDEIGSNVNKELVIPKEGRECLFKLPKGIYTYEIILSNKETYKKGEYNFEEELVITVKDN